MRILFLTHRLPYAPNRGDRIRALHTLRLLAAHAEVDLVSLVHDRDEEQHAGDLRDLVASVTVARVSKSLGYGRAVVSRLSGDPILYSSNGFAGAARQALTKLGVTWEPSEAERAYNEGRSTQIPVNPVVRIKGRFSRRLRDGQQELVLAR